MQLQSPAPSHARVATTCHLVNVVLGSDSSEQSVLYANPPHSTGFIPAPLHGTIPSRPQEVVRSIVGVAAPDGFYYSSGRPASSRQPTTAGNWTGGGSRAG